MTDVYHAWIEGKPSEVHFWKTVIDGTNSHIDYHQDLLDRADPDRKVIPWLPRHIITSPLKNAKILDVGAGPVTVIGWIHEGVRLNITPIDALADEYNEMLRKFDVDPPTRTLKCNGEDIATMFERETFDLVHSRNALDHCFDPMKVIKACISVLKPGGSMVIYGNNNEAERGEYEGLHQWNLTVEGGDLVIWRPGARISARRRLKADAQVEGELQGELGMFCVIQKHESPTSWLRHDLDKRV